MNDSVLPSLETLDTPTLLLDETKLDRNIARLRARLPGSAHNCVRI